MELSGGSGKALSWGCVKGWLLGVGWGFSTWMLFQDLAHLQPEWFLRAGISGMVWAVLQTGMSGGWEHMPEWDTAQQRVPKSNSYLVLKETFHPQPARSWWGLQEVPRPWSLLFLVLKAELMAVTGTRGSLTCVSVPGKAGGEPGRAAGHRVWVESDLLGRGACASSSTSSGLKESTAGLTELCCSRPRAVLHLIWIQCYKCSIFPCCSPYCWAWAVTFIPAIP